MLAVARIIIGEQGNRTTVRQFLFFYGNGQSIHNQTNRTLSTRPWLQFCARRKGDDAMKATHFVAQEFLSTEPKRLFIEGEWVDAQSGKTLEAYDPGDGQVIAHLAAGDAADVDLAVAAAREAFRKSGWATMPVNDRAVILHRLADLVDKHREILAQIESLDVGKPLAQPMANDIPNVSQTLRYYAYDLSVHTHGRARTDRRLRI